MATAPSPLPKPAAGLPCSCGSGLLFENCCGPLISGEQRPATAEALMRSRFTAHVANAQSYLHRTYRVSARQPFVEDREAEPMKWTRLTILSHEPGPGPDQAFVEFSAFFTDETGEHVVQEKSEFARVEGQWLYTRCVRAGPAPLKTAAKVGRNDPCPCGSGKKYKHCCLTKS